MARALNKVMRRRGAVFADRYHARLLASPRETRGAVRYVLDNWIGHARRDGQPPPEGVDPGCSTAWQDHSPPLVAKPRWWMLRADTARRDPEVRLAA